MKIVKRTTIKEISAEMLAICTDEKISYKDSKKRLWDLFTKLRRTKILSVSDMKDLIHLHRELSKIKNKKAFFREEEISKNILVDLPLKISYNEEEYSLHKNDIFFRREILKSDENDNNFQRESLKIAARLVNYGKEIIASKDDKSKRYSNRVREALNWMTQMYQFHDIEGIKKILQSKITNKYEQIQYFAIFGLEIYYSYEDADELEDEVKKQLVKLIKTTKNRMIASNCCKILEYEGYMNYHDTLDILEKWEKRNWG